jgi:benzoyl-CoA reductase/2-hydroxyglutaryl-CoA dehydratase subunit BcrC/BadD/HgdB
MVYVPQNKLPIRRKAVNRIADIYIGETTCDGKKKAWEILQEEVKTAAVKHR